jgi:protein-L-isoaspartate(D-aspartate) O-methyltransferase
LEEIARRQPLPGPAPRRGTDSSAAGLEESEADGLSRKKQEFLAALRVNLRQSGVSFPRPLARAFGQVDRGRFVPGQAWNDSFETPLSGPPATQPTLIAWMMAQGISPAYLRRLERKDTGRFLNLLIVGTGAGYSTAILAEYLRNVRGHRQDRIVSIERVPRYRKVATKRLNQEYPSVEVHRARPDALGWPEAAPYDAILVFAQTDNRLALASLLAQLRPGGRLVLPWGSGEGFTSRLAVYRRRSGSKGKIRFSEMGRLEGVGFVDLALPPAFEAPALLPGSGLDAGLEEGGSRREFLKSLAGAAAQISGLGEAVGILAQGFGRLAATTSTAAAAPSVPSGASPWQDYRAEFLVLVGRFGGTDMAGAALSATRGTGDFDAKMIAIAKEAGPSYRVGYEKNFRSGIEKRIEGAHRLADDVHRTSQWIFDLVSLPPEKQQAFFNRLRTRWPPWWRERFKAILALDDKQLAQGIAWANQHRMEQFQRDLE